jgi:hypothetical protein
MKVLFLTGLIIFVIGCGVSTQIKEAKTFAKCEFRLRSVTDLHLADINIQKVKSVSDLSLKKAAQLMAALKGGKPLPLTFTLNIQARNPNKEVAAMNKLEWILLVDDHEMARGVLEETVQVLPDSAAEFPLKISSDLEKSLSGASRESMLKLAFNLVGEGNAPTHILAKLKPTIVIAGVSIAYPGYIDVQKEFTSTEGGRMIRKELKKSGENSEKK